MSMFSGFMSGGKGGYDAAGDVLRQGQSDALGGYKPYQDAGTGQIPILQDQENKFLDPNYINTLMEGYETSPYTQQMMSQATQQGMGAADQMGLGGSSAAQRNITGMAGQLGQQDRDNYLKQVMQAQGMGVGIGQGLYQGGLTGAQGAANTYGQFAPQIAGAEYGSKNAGGSMFGNLLGMGTSLLGAFL